MLLLAIGVLSAVPYLCSSKMYLNGSLWDFGWARVFLPYIQIQNNLGRAILHLISHRMFEIMLPPPLFLVILTWLLSRPTGTLEF